MLRPDVQQVVEDFLARTACPFCKVWLDGDEMKAVLSVAEADGLMEALIGQHELVCGEYQEGRRKYANEAL